ncbi:MAG: GTPase [Candidatus Diapherotrites archaeon]|nr:GTPase [Candidatus Diapherotrites archaeon]
MKKKVIILGAAGRDFHNFNTYYRDNANYEVVAFTAEQIPGIDDKKYPAELAGKNYPNGIQIYSEKELSGLIKKFNVDEVVLSYSDLPYEYVMNRSALVNAEGANFVLLGTKDTQIKSNKKVIGVCAVRTGCGKSQTSRAIVKILKNHGIKAAAIRHPMPYGDLVKQKVQAFREMNDLKKHECTIEEMEEYEPYIAEGLSIFAGVDYGAILKEAEKEADLILWDGGNNDFSFYKTDLLITVADPLRAGHEVSYYPGEVNFRAADIILINKINSAKPEQIKLIEDNAKKVNPKAKIIKADSVLELEEKIDLKGKKVLVVEDGPTVTHGGMGIGAGYVYAKEHGAEIIDATKNSVGLIKSTFEKYNHLKNVLPAMGYSEQQVKDLETTINNTECDLVVSGTPIDLNRLVKANKKIVHVKYALSDKAKKELEEELKKRGFI